MHQKEFDDLFSSKKVIGFHQANKKMREMVIDNGNELYSYLRRLQDNDEVFNDMDELEIIFEGNRLLLNFLNSFRAFLDHSSQGYLTKNHKKDYEDLISRFYDSNFSYRFFYKLRNFITHYSFPFTTVEQSYERTFLKVRKEDLLEFEKWGAIKNEVEELEEEIDLVPYIKEFIPIINALSIQKMYYYKEQIKEAHKMAVKYVQECEGTFGFIHTPSRSEFRNKNFNIIPFTLSDIHEAAKDLNAHPHINVNFH
ncbi:hypothetical protein J0K78_03085 [Halobacillus sp. GSS1]|uniref:hypothetical protein n=1 Tax=Halobacillus sp. GSS1 TaxID=2815919 RepID=UPI001A8C6206|nr:hypothetical protein [Halobacillus sp. GSS1]MBN9653237.1 hypothetical protein [Halobacillus sp. GSS1]